MLPRKYRSPARWIYGLDPDKVADKNRQMSSRRTTLSNVQTWYDKGNEEVESN